MTPEQKLKWAILLMAEPGIEVTQENVDALFDDDARYDTLSDAKQEFRSGEVETGLACQWSRHYESKSVAAKMPDDSWVGWTYWYGGGKHGEPEAVDWIDDAYELSCHEEEKLVVVRTFTKAEAA